MAELSGTEGRTDSPMRRTVARRAGAVSPFDRVVAPTHRRSDSGWWLPAAKNENRYRLNTFESFSTECLSLSTMLDVSGQLEVMRCSTAGTWVPWKAGRG
jgi:hypothetical protein